MAESPKEEEKNKHKEWFIEKAEEFIDRGCLGIAKQFFKKAGLKEQEINLLVKGQLDQAKTPRRQKEQRQKPREIKLTPYEKIRLRELGMTFVAKNQKNTAEVCFRRAGVLDKKIKSLLNLNLVRIDKEKEKLKEELVKIKKGT